MHCAVLTRPEQTPSILDAPPPPVDHGAISVQSVADEQALRATIDGRRGVVLVHDAAVQALDRELDRWLDPITPASEPWGRAASASVSPFCSCRRGGVAFPRPGFGVTRQRRSVVVQVNLPACGIWYWAISYS
jgi:hypothetical protein